MLQDKLDFLLNEFPRRLLNLDPSTRGNWGKLNGQQMVEHFTEYVGIASGRVVHPRFTPDDQLERMKAFLKSDKPFRENTPNPLLPAEPPVPVHRNMHEAVNALKSELDYFVSYFKANSTATTSNPFFGELDFEENVHLLYKHALHHLRQFSLNE